MKSYEIIIFDMDGVLTEEASSWNKIHEYFGVENSKDLEEYTMGKINYREFMRRDIVKWPKVHISEIEKIFLGSKPKIIKGAKKTINELKNKEYKIGLVSAGLDILANKIGNYLDIDYILANGLEIDRDGNLTGEGICRVELLRKDKTLVNLSKKIGVPLSKLAAIGDSKYDISMLELADFSIAFNPKDEEIKKVVDVVIEGNDISKILIHFQ